MELPTEQSPKHIVWKQEFNMNEDELYCLQLEAPKPEPICNNKSELEIPSHLGYYYYGDMSHSEAEAMLIQYQDGCYIVRNSRSALGKFYTLSLKFNNEIHHYKLYYDSQGFYVNEKRYGNVKTLVADGLVHMYLKLKTPAVLKELENVNYEDSPYMTLNHKRLARFKEERKKNNFTCGPDSIFTLHCENKDAMEKLHQFKIKTFKGLNWCELCGNFLWGFTAQGVKCDDCGLVAHVKCSKCSHPNCVPDLKYLRGVFGIELTTLLTAHNVDLPFVVTKCITEVEARGLTSEGIYRLSGFADEIDTIKTVFDKDGEKANLSQDKYPNINVIAGALKLYLRLLPIPLIPFKIYPGLITAMSQNKFDSRLTCMKQTLFALPKAHYYTLRYLLDHLHRVALHSAINKMNSHNLATVFAPTLVGPKGPLTSTTLPDMTTDIVLIDFLITHNDKVFDNSL